MPHLPTTHCVHPRDLTNINPATTTDAVSLIVGVSVSIVVLVVVLLLIKFLLLPWFRRFRFAKAAREKAIADQTAWYRSTRPIVRQKATPRIINAYTRSPHIQSEQQRVVDVEANILGTGIAEHLHSRSNTTQVSSAEALSGSSRIRALGSEPFPAFDLDLRASVEAGYDLDLRLLDNRQTRDTVGSVASIGVAVPVCLPVAQMPVAVYHGRRSSLEDKDAGIFVVGDGETG